MATQRAQALFSLLLLLSSLLLIIPSFASDPKEKRCAKECRGIPEKHDRKDCERRCIGRQQEREEWEKHEEEEEEERGRREHNPYYFSPQSYEEWTRTPHGQFKVLERFSKKSDLLRGIESFRLAILEAEPKTFILPSHLDAEELFYVMEGRGIIMLLREENRESYEIKKGDIMRIPAGVIVYALNNHNEKLRVAIFLQPIFTPGHFEEFFGAAGRNPGTFYTSFSTEVLEAAFNTPRDRLDRLFRQRKGEIIRASEEQIRELSQSATEGRGFVYPPEQSNKPFNLLKKQPSHSNDYGELYEAKIDDYEQLKDLDVDVSIANISQSSMMAPNYNSRATKVALVVEGRGYFEMACPHLTGEPRRKRGEEEEEEERERQSYKVVRSQVSRGSVFVIPAGHPVVAVAASGENLQVLCFGIRAEKNEKFFLTGRNNVFNNLDRKAKELSFAAPAEEVTLVFEAQTESVFLPGPERRRWEERGRRPPMESMLRFAV